MVSYQEAIASVQQQARQARQSLAEQRRRLTEQRKQILSPRALRETTYAQRQQQLRQLTGQQQQLTQYEQQIGVAETQAIQTLEAQRKSITEQLERGRIKRATKRLEKWAKLSPTIPTGIVMVDGTRYAVPPPQQEEFAAEQIEKYGATEVKTHRYVYTAGEIPAIQPTRIGKPEEFFEYAKRPDVVLYGKEVERFKAAGYTPREARALAEYSMATQTTPTPLVAERYLRGELKIPPEGKVARGIFYTAQALQVPYKAKEYILEKTYPYTPMAAVERGLTFIGVPKEYQAIGITSRVITPPAPFPLFGIPEIGPPTERRILTLGPKQVFKIGVEAPAWLAATPVMTGIYGTEIIGRGIGGVQIARATVGVPTYFREWFKEAPVRRTIELGTSALILSPAASWLTGRVRAALTVPKPVRRLEPSIRPDIPLRERAVVIVRDKKGRVLYELDKNTRMYILPGGKVGARESAKAAAKRELAEETGLIVKDLKQIDTVQTPREINYVFEYVVKDIDRLKLVPQTGEVLGFKVIKPREYTGPTALKPFGERGIRSDDLFIGSRAKHVVDVNKEIKALTEAERQVLVTEARTWAEQTFGAERIKGISSQALVRDYLLSQKGALYRSLLIPAEAGRPPMLVGFGSRYDIPFRELKRYKGELYYVHATPQRIPTQYEYFTKDIKKVGADIEEQFTVLAKRVKRGEPYLYFQPPVTAKGAEAYLGVSYLGLLKRKGYEFPEITWGLPKRPAAYLAKAKAGEDLVFTEKAIRGVEFEVGAAPLTRFAVREVGRPFYLMGKRIEVKEIKILRDVKELEQLRAGWKEVKPSELIYKKEVTPYPAIAYDIRLAAERTRVSYKTPTEYKIKGEYSLIGKYEPVIGYRAPKYKMPPYKPEPYKAPPYEPPPYEPPRRLPSERERVSTKALKKLAKAYRTYYLRAGKKEYLAGVAPRVEAIKKGERKVLRGVAATFGIEEAGLVPRRMPESFYQPSPRIFRAFQIRAGKRISLKERWIQKAGTIAEPTIKGARLAAKAEVRELLAFKKAKGGKTGWLMGGKSLL